MINKENDKDQVPEPKKEESGILDVAYMDVQCHIRIQDKDTGETLVNKRG